MDEYYETITVKQLFEEELEAIQEQHEKLVELDTPESRDAADSLYHVIRYFKKRLELDDWLEERGPSDSLH